uniref:AIG1-type G domain-containing protein n=1 Tax=Chromera velia CCMP2878 TaxID=1169474 RepID=A0A0G4G0Y5_9ALVE|mmetsp:Transcript_29032/g.56856  ORF Transcript_29032/g.56856 Transcript_29032/m.56856 type:complete len:746 (-) Transcript_29032:466-2703(-)|eukprot:Cvel_19694.t1-p1 / transcript=Cvel_19694.t1 / gene=Cvel_19694 / organism=Chromera_velia_CCMP2878 / gene_product=GTPase IMAP family member 4, putative / transcript_product=GTPase IMAP family member 4, putative / location=Cvel_scaffold1718:13418-18065(-) / protein_length=745 / sequence_SO=supercontig / SO=protein_coding / is_pseudo=false
MSENTPNTVGENFPPASAPPLLSETPKETAGLEIQNHLELVQDLRSGWLPCPQGCAFGGCFPCPSFFQRDEMEGEGRDGVEWAVCDCGFEFCSRCGASRESIETHDARYHFPHCTHQPSAATACVIGGGGPTSEEGPGGQQEGTPACPRAEPHFAPCNRCSLSGRSCPGPPLPDGKYPETYLGPLASRRGLPITEKRLEVLMEALRAGRMAARNGGKGPGLSWGHAGAHRPFVYALAGKTGAGKSESGNSLSGTTSFIAASSFSSVTESVCSCNYSFKPSMGDVDVKSPEGLAPSEWVAIDTPGFFDTQQSRTELLQKVGEFAREAPMGLDALLVVVREGRATEEELRTLQQIENAFGEEIWKHAVILVTHCRNSSIVEEIVELPLEHPLRKACEKAEWRVWKIDNRPAGAGEETERQRDRAMIHMLMRRARNKRGAVYDSKSFQIAREERLRTLVSDEFGALAQYEAELEETHRGLASGRLTKAEFEMHRKRILDRAARAREEMGQAERARLSRRLEASDSVREWGMKAGIAVAGATAVGTVTYLTAAALAGVATTAAMPLAASGAGALMWSRAHPTSFQAATRAVGTRWGSLSAFIPSPSTAYAAASGAVGLFGRGTRAASSALEYASSFVASGSGGRASASSANEEGGDTVEMQGATSARGGRGEEEQRWEDYTRPCPSSVSGPLAGVGVERERFGDADMGGSVDARLNPEGREGQNEKEGGKGADTPPRPSLVDVQAFMHV